MAKTDTDDKTATRTPAKSPEERAAAKRVTRLLAQGLFDHAWSAENPEADRKARRAAFKAGIKDYTKAGRKMRLFLERQGLQMTAGDKPVRAKKAGAAAKQPD